VAKENSAALAIINFQAECNLGTPEYCAVIKLVSLLDMYLELSFRN